MNPKTSFRLSDEVKQKLYAIMQKRCLTSLNDAVIYTIVEVYEREVNNYKEAIKKRKDINQNRTPEQRVADELARQEEKRKTKDIVLLASGRRLCGLLDGREIDNKNGTYGCEYQIHEKVGKTVMSGKRIVPYDLLTDEHVATQYIGGNKEEIVDLLMNIPI